MVSEMMRLDIASVSTPSSPLPASMRMRWSFLAISSSAPSSTLLRPSFHWSTTRIEYCSISSGFDARHDQHGQLGALGGLERGELLLERPLLLGGERAGQVGDTRGELGDRLQVLGGGGPAEPQEPEQREPGRERRARVAADHCVAGCPEGAAAGAPGVEVSKLTVGAVEICASLATVKFGFTWKPNIFAVRFTGNWRTVTL